MTEDWSDVAPRYWGLKGWFWHLPYLSPTHEFMAYYVAFGLIDLDIARDLLDDKW